MLHCHSVSDHPTRPLLPKPFQVCIRVCVMHTHTPSCRYSASHYLQEVLTHSPYPGSRTHHGKGCSYLAEPSIRIWGLNLGFPQGGGGGGGVDVRVESGGLWGHLTPPFGHPPHSMFCPNTCMQIPKYPNTQVRLAVNLGGRGETAGLSAVLLVIKDMFFHVSDRWVVLRYIFRKPLKKGFPVT